MYFEFLDFFKRREEKAKEEKRNEEKRREC